MRLLALALLFCGAGALSAAQVLSNGLAHVGGAASSLAHGATAAGAAVGGAASSLAPGAAAAGAAVGSAASGAATSLAHGVDVLGGAVTHTVASAAGTIGVQVEEGLESLAQLGDGERAPALDLAAAFPLPAASVEASMAAWRAHFAALLAPAPLQPPFPRPPYSPALQSQWAQALLADLMQRIEQELLPLVAEAQQWPDSGVGGGALMYALRGVRGALEENRGEASSSAAADALHSRVLDACLRQVDAMAPPYVSRANASDLSAALKALQAPIKGSAPAAQGARLALTFGLKRVLGSASVAGSLKSAAAWIPLVGPAAVNIWDAGSVALSIAKGRKLQVRRILAFRELAREAYAAFLGMVAHVSAQSAPPAGAAAFAHEWARLQGYEELGATLALAHEEGAAQDAAHAEAAAAAAAAPPRGG